MRCYDRKVETQFALSSMDLCHQASVIAHGGDALLLGATAMTCGIYGIYNTVSKKMYVGQSVNIEGRKSSHFSKLTKGFHYNTYIQHAFNKDGIENFEFYILCECEEDEMDNQERQWINYYDSQNPEYGYNLEDGGLSRHHHTEETKRKMSEAARNISEYKRMKIIESNRTRFISDETRRKHSESQRLRQFLKPASQETREKISKANIGRHHSTETLQFLKDRWTPEMRLVYSLHRKGKTPSEEHRKHLSEALKKHVRTKEHQNKLNEARRRRPLKTQNIDVEQTLPTGFRRD